MALPLPASAPSGNIERGEHDHAGVVPDARQRDRESKSRFAPWPLDSRLRGKDSSVWPGLITPRRKAAEARPPVRGRAQAPR